MRRLLLLRHAKAVAKDAAEDFDRVLAEDGRSDMALMAEVLTEPALVPDLALVSPSARTRETWSLTRLRDVRTRFEPAIYEATAETLLAILRGSPDEARSVMLVGHNPGIEELAQALVGKAARGGDATLLRAGLPTAGLVALDLPVDTWRSAAFGGGRLDRVVTPASLGGRDG